MIEARAVSKSFGPTRALSDVTMSVAAGEMRALLGRNGAGKSTMVSLLTGLLTPDHGELLIGGLPPASAESVACVYQHSRLVPALSVSENIMMGGYPRGAWGQISWPRLRDAARRELEPWGLADIASRLVEDIDPVQAKVVEICRALARSPRVVLLDEPTAGLDRRDAERLFEFIRQLKERAVTLIYVSHHLDEVYRLCDSATVLRDARHIVTAPLSDLPKQALINAMVGQQGHSPFLGHDSKSHGAVDLPKVEGETRLEVKGLSVTDRVIDFDLTVKRGECVGIAGLEGSGKAELGAALAGLLKPDRGALRIDGRSFRLGDVRAAIRAGIGYVPQNRHAQGMVTLLPVSENATMTATRMLARPLIPGLLNVLFQSDRDKVYERLARQWQIVAASPQQLIGELSGGNQQKCVMARGLATDPKVLVLQNPTAGIDVAAKASIMRSLRDILAKGASVVVISEDADDFALCSRVVVINRGKAGRQLGAEWTEGELVAAMQGIE
ncbi:sugar ABC transporter ATP-binding protein [Mesorhizobium sp. M0088]|uniref:sugar ABC transporter ATP-binding protein n=1 Tax=Mesorhizobium sp. M0088 TaxID=2956873 RepID=UPI0033395ED5